MDRSNENNIIQIPSVGSSIVSYSGDWNMGYHKHVGLEISIVLEGTGFFQCAGIETCLEKGDIVMIQSDVLHHYHTYKSSIRFAVLELRNMEEKFTQSFNHILKQDKAKILRFSNLHLEQYEAMFRIWLRTLSDPAIRMEDTIPIWANLFLFFIVQSGRTDPGFLSVAAAADYIRTQLDGEIKVGELAQQCGLSDATFRRSFQAVYGMAPKKYQQQCRMSEAKWLLRSSNKPIQIIAEQVGFSGVHAFSSWFQLKEGVAPSEWRKRQNGTLSSS